MAYNVKDIIFAFSEARSTCRNTDSGILEPLYLTMVIVLSAGELASINLMSSHSGLLTMIPLILTTWRWLREPNR